MTQMGAQVTFDEGKCTVTKDNRTINLGHIVDNKLYVVNTKEQATCNIAKTAAPTLEQWHCRYGHLNYGYVNQLAQGNLVEGLNYLKGKVKQDCEACAQGKMHRLPFPKKSVNKATTPLELIHSDLCGPMNVNSIGGSKYVLTFTDDYTRYVTVYFIKSKAEVLSKFEEYVNMVENATGLKVKILRTDNGGEYVSHDFAKYCKDKGIFQQFTNPYTPEQNGTSERLNRTLIESAKSMMIHAQMPLDIWAEAVNTAAYLHNRSPTKVLKDKTPYECWFGQKPNVSNLKVFGCTCFVHTPDSLRKKLDPKSRKGIFVGYPLDTKGYKVYDIESKTFIRSRKVLFHEDKFHEFQSNKSETVLKESD